MKAWHFVAADKRLGYEDGRIVRVGKTYKVKGAPILCSRGLHASVRLLDALAYAKSPILSYVELGGIIVKGDDKVVATERTVLWMDNISTILHRFACNEAERALDAVEATGEGVSRASRDAIAVKRRWLWGGATDADLHVAEVKVKYRGNRQAAYEAMCATRNATGRTAEGAARLTAASAAATLARLYVLRAGWSAGHSAARSAQNRRLTAMVRRAMK